MACADKTRGPGVENIIMLPNKVGHSDDFGSRWAKELPVIQKTRWSVSACLYCSTRLLSGVELPCSTSIVALFSDSAGALYGAGVSGWYVPALL